MRRKKSWLSLLSDSITREDIGQWKFKKFRRSLDDLSSEPEDYNLKPPNIIFLKLLIIFLVSIFLMRLFWLMIIKGDENRIYAQENRVRLTEVEPERGTVFDRNGRVLAVSRRSYLLKNDTRTIEITREQAGELENEGLAGENFTGNLGRIYQEVQRKYSLGEAAAHLLGYTAVPAKEDLENNQSLSLSQKIGRLGIEAYYNEFLKGKVGKKLIEVDAIGRNVSILGSTLPEKGKDIHLTVDLELQKKVYEVLKRAADSVGSEKGAVIIQNPQNGEVLALVSVPSFNPEKIEDFLEDENNPFLNRAISGVYPPGSVFKIVSALAGLESGVISSNTEIEDVGEFYLGNNRFVNWYYLVYGGRDGVLKIDRAIARSNDIFFYKLAEKVGLSAIRQMAIKIGFGQKTGIDLPSEAFGLVPDEIWKKSAYGQAWYLGDTMHLGIGQGFMLATPIQVNMMTSFMASGKLTRPYLVSKIVGNGKNIEFGSKILGENFVKSENFNLVREGMKKACEKGGTGWPFFDASYKAGCKTGTAEKALGNPHAWFTVFAPYDAPKISVTVLIENGGEGSSVAGPVAREILDWYFKHK